MENLTENLLENVCGKSVLITGATTGIGRATAILLSKMGANVLVAGASEQHLKDSISDVKTVAKGKVHGIIADLSSKEGIQKLFSEFDAQFPQLDILINNAALASGSVTDGNYDDWKRVIDTNLLAYLACASEAIKRMKAKGEGHILNVGSMSADVREETGAVYVATKAGIQGFSEALRKEINPLGIKVSLVEPGAVDTDMQPASSSEKKEKVSDLEMLTADDIALAIYYCLCQPKRCDVVNLKIRPHLQLI